MFEIVGDDIAALNDADLRVLIARLCEAEVQKNGLFIAAITAGGDQNAPDGGLDIRIELPAGSKIAGFIPKENTGFQVKKPDMPGSEIRKEMRPKSTLRPVIQELAAKGGAYIIVSSTGSVSDRALSKRRQAMRDAAADDANAAKLDVDFYDRERIASWVRQYPGVSSWLRQQLGKPLQGWQPYGSWSAPIGLSNDNYLADGKSRLHDDRHPREDGLSIEQGVNRIREILSQQNGAVRLIGLSGMGKTRLAQALFDGRIGEKALNSSEVVYTDVADRPTPSPRDVIQYFIGNNQRAIIIVDNCNPEMHRSLATACSIAGSKVSLLTIEYDIGEDDPEGTEVFRLEAASDELIEKLIERRDPKISQVDRRRIAEFSSGNARVALALARTVQRGETLGQLTDRELFGRLFHQRRPEDRNLLQAAEACSLVYSFDGETTVGDGAELPILAELAGLTVDDLYRHLGELKSRDLLQKRGKWRAFLPHALANKLARSAIESVPPSKITIIMINRAPARLQKSFSRRLGYLHASEAAQNIVQAWLCKDGLLGNLAKLSPLGWQIFFNVVPVAPVAALNALETALNGEMESVITNLDSSERYKIGTLLRSLAYEAEHFERAAKLLSRFVIAEPADHSSNSLRRVFVELFQLYLSGTHATGQQRLQLIESLLTQSNKRDQECGVAALNNMLEAWHFSSSHGFSFGARSRDYGWQPRTREQILNWYTEAINFTAQLIANDHPRTEQLKSILAANFRALWTRAYVFDALENAVGVIAKNGFWPDAWPTVKRTIYFDAQRLPSEALSRLRRIEDALKPSGLLEKAKTYVLFGAGGAFDLADIEDDEPSEMPGSRYERAELIARSLGKEVATTPEVLAALLPDLAQGQNGGRRCAFGMGLAEGADDLTSIWNMLRLALQNTPEANRNVQTLIGFLVKAAKINPTLTGSFLDAAVADPILGAQFPILQGSVEIDNGGVERLRQALKLRLAPTWTFRQLAYGRATNSIPAHDLYELLWEIHILDDGKTVAIDILRMVFQSPENSEKVLDRKLIQLSRHFLEQWPFGERSLNQPTSNIDYELSILVDNCLHQPDGEASATKVCQNFLESLMDYRASTHDYFRFMSSLFKAKPYCALNVFVRANSSNITKQIAGDFLSDDYFPINEVPDQILIQWANEEAHSRYPALAALTRLFAAREGETTPSLSSKALLLLENGPNKSAVLKQLEAGLHPNSWSGSLADILEKRREALSTLVAHKDADVSRWATECDKILAERAKQERASEIVRDERFE